MANDEQITKRLVLLNLPYALMGLYATNLGYAWRLAVGLTSSEKMMSLMSVLPDALAALYPASTHWTWLWVCAAAQGCGWRSTSKARMPRKYRHGSEYGSARWSA